MYVCIHIHTIRNPKFESTGMSSQWNFLSMLDDPTSTYQNKLLDPTNLYKFLYFVGCRGKEKINK